MEQIIKSVFDNDFNIYELSKQFYNIRGPFTGINTPEITYASWQYSVRHLPLSIFLNNNNMPINYFLHLPGDHYNNKGMTYTFSGMPLGWDVYNGENISCECRIINKTCCQIHINMRDVYNDICEFVSNLLVHIKFMELNKNETIVIYMNNACKNDGECGSIFKSSNEYKNIDKESIITEINLNNPPTYTVKINNINKKIIYNANKHINLKFDKIFKQINSEIKRFYKSANFKIHIIQKGNGRPRRDIMMLDHPTIDLQNVELKNKYGGKYKQYDEYIGKLSKHGNEQLWKDTETINSRWYKSLSINNNAYSLLFLNKVKISKTMDPVFINLVNSIHDDENIVLLNMPYSFGSEAYNIGNSIIKTFGNKLSSFQVIGKAGGIGNKIKINDYVIANKLNLSYSTIFNNNRDSEIELNVDNIDTSLTSGHDVTVHKSGVMNVPSVIFQEKSYLKSIANNYNAIEMEGYWYSSALKKNIPQLYLYYISDLPLKISLAHESYHTEEGQTLFNGLFRMGFDWITKLLQYNKNAFCKNVKTSIKTSIKTKKPKTKSTTRKIKNN